jgi:DNA repair ATPase RecN
MQTRHVSKLGIKHTQWMKSLGFYDDEIALMENRLSELAKKHNHSQDIMRQVEHFQNQFIVQKNNIDELTHSIHENYEKAARESEAMLGHVSEERIAAKEKLESEVIDFEKNFARLKHEFNLFLSHIGH